MSNGSIEIVGGDPPEPPKPADSAGVWVLMIGFDPVNQGLMIDKPDQVKSWDMVCGILHMATLQAQFYRNMGHGQLLENAQMQKIQEAAMKEKLARERQARGGKR